MKYARFYILVFGISALLYPGTSISQTGADPVGDHPCITCSTGNIIPIGETTFFMQWAHPGDYPPAAFGGRLQPDSVNFKGCIVKERDPGEKYDNCHYYGSEIPPNTGGITGSMGWTVGDENKWWPDIVRIWTKPQIEWYRNYPLDNPSAAQGCNAIWPQQMFIQCPDYDYTYVYHGRLESVIRMSEVDITRNEVTVTWPSSEE
jgi:hypothetical protein